MPSVLVPLMKNGFIDIGIQEWVFINRVLKFVSQLCCHSIYTQRSVFFCSDFHFNYARVLPAVLTRSLAPLSVDAGAVPLLLLEETQGPEGGGLPCVCTPRWVGGHPRKCAQLRRGRWRGTGPGKFPVFLVNTRTVLNFFWRILKTVICKKLSQFLTFYTCCYITITIFKVFY